ncbi:hypothetical protein A6A07_37720 [Streptomyces sp. CB03911]|nr:hypothetical protein A6A07_37720 [Streptomyces sp. CB03911]
MVRRRRSLPRAGGALRRFFARYAALGRTRGGLGVDTDNSSGALARFQRHGMTADFAAGGAGAGVVQGGSGRPSVALVPRARGRPVPLRGPAPVGLVTVAVCRVATGPSRPARPARVPLHDLSTTGARPLTRS